MSRGMCAARGIRHIWVRILSVYGPYDAEGSMVMSTVRRLLAGEKVAFTAGEQTWDYLYSRDAARALMAVAERGLDGRVYCLGSGKAHPLREYITTIYEAVFSSTPPVFGEIPYAEGQVMHLCADTEQLRADTGWRPEVSFEEGIRRTIAFAMSEK